MQNDLLCNALEYLNLRIIMTNLLEGEGGNSPILSTIHSNHPTNAFFHFFSPSPVTSVLSGWEGCRVFDKQEDKTWLGLQNSSCKWERLRSRVDSIPSRTFRRAHSKKRRVCYLRTCLHTKCRQTQQRLTHQGSKPGK